MVSLKGNQGTLPLLFPSLPFKTKYLKRLFFFKQAIKLGAEG